jgi:hypothetical protein
MYVDVGKTLITASGIAVAIIVSGLAGKISLPAWMLRRSVVALIICIVFSILTILALTRSYERARSRSGEHSEGTLTDFELLIILLLADVGLTAFLWGFLYLGRIVFYIGKVGYMNHASQIQAMCVIIGKNLVAV